MPKRYAIGTSLGLSSRLAGPKSSAVVHGKHIKSNRSLLETLEGRVLLSATPLATALGTAHHHSIAAAVSAPAAPAVPTASAAATTMEAASTSAVSSATQAPLAGDVNLDGTVNFADFSILSAHYGQKTGATWADGDFTGDGAVNFADFSLMGANYGMTWNTGGGGTSGSITAISNQAPAGINWSGPIVIRSGGTYTGNWQSLNVNTPAVEVQTTQPVVIINSNIQSKGNLIYSGVHHSNVTIKNTHGWGLNPNVYGQSPGRFFDDNYFDNVDAENNTMVGTAGIYMGYYLGNGTTSQTVKVLKNVAQNIDGRWSDGNGGFLIGADQNDYVQFAQFNACNNMAGVEIAWNQVINLPGQSRVEDNISVYESSGTSASNMLIHDNYIQGAYPADPANDNSFTGGGIMLSDGSTRNAATECGYVSAYNNIIVGTTNYGLAISSGHDNTIYNNTVISSGLLPGGQKIASQNVGIYIWDNINDPYWGNNQEYGNTIGWMGSSGRNDSWTPNASGRTGDTILSGTITLAKEQSYYSVWAQKVGTSGYVIGAA